MITILNACVIGYGVHVHAHSQLVNKLSLCHIKSYSTFIIITLLMVGNVLHHILIKIQPIHSVA